ncbi:helix-turn-helix domain-containing protein [Nakamurella lactea]|uniref:helix-turn-helix domain-containing protein n=1 Tax=Nakamurella lactea TaxID=459515 RepID=UPI001B7FA76B|nr:helix-turn-helix domain-containing protein [Nakamurella lactea]
MPLWPDVGRLLGIGRNQAYEAARQGEIPSLHLGRTWLVPVPKLLELLGYRADSQVKRTAGEGSSVA